MEVSNSICPNCKQKCMVYRRNIRKGMVIALQKLSERHTPTKSSELGIPIGINADFSKLRFWGLIYKDLQVDRDKWEITKKGQRFLFEEKPIPKYLFIFNNEVQGISDELITASEILETSEEINKETVLESARPIHEGGKNEV